MKPMSKIVTSVTQLTFWFMVILGIYIILHGHLTPGGGFQGGVVLASGYALLLVAFGREQSNALLPKTAKVVFALLGFFLVNSILLLFLPTAAYEAGGIFAAIYKGIAYPGGLFGVPVLFGINGGVLNTGGTLPLKNIATGLEVLSGVLLLVLFMYRGLDDNFTRDESGLVNQGGVLDE